MDWVAIVGGLIIAYLLHSIYKAWQESRAPPPEPTKWMVGDITELTLASHSGYDWSKPTLIAVKGIVYDVSKSNDQYGPGELGGKLHLAHTRMAWEEPMHVLLGTP
jgi:hypothetical protein